ncbi:choice-of-anchor Q domain-containing protein [Salmonirosea aquatica]|uniref:G8 domain-containing protein n=1 Tax=Salmonirosea aquatica TaxID=2654236 RepID=A0A7C9BKH7_9BACT|nr:hypothetical protein [Cytophagaceae bacterium SJW1-29]
MTATFTLFEASETDYTGSNNLTTTVSPFVSISSAQLSPCSPAIDAGLNTANTTTIDLAGNQRLINGTIDMGAYEFQSNQNTFQRTWIGSLNSSWNEPGNWSPACLPTAADAVFINASPNDPIVGSGLSVHTGIITLNISVTLTVDNGGTLNVHGSGGALGNINMNSGILNQGGLIKYL